MQQAEAAGLTATVYRGVPGTTVGRRAQTPGPGPMGRPGLPTPTPTPMPTVTEGVRALSTTGSLDLSRLRSRGALVRERYQALEEKQRSTSLRRSLSRPVLLSSVRSFSYEYPTQVAEMERMSDMQDSSPPPPYMSLPGLPSPPLYPTPDA